MAKTSDSFIKQNQEYVKARTTTSGSGYREQPQRQAGGGRGYDKPDFARWTYSELLEHAYGLGLLSDGEARPRAELIDLLEAAQPPE